MHRHLIALFAVSLVASVSSAAPADESEALRKLMDEFVEAYNRHDARAMADLFAPDADVCVSLSRYRGRDQIERFFTGLEGNPIESLSKEASIRFLTPNVALMDVETKLTGLRGVNGAELPALLIKACFIVTKNNDRWIYGALRIQTFSSSQTR
jgi:uncharacterized protein (TIGR02246 family)